MHNNLHPDTLYELNKQYQQERVLANKQLRPFVSQTDNGRSLTDRMLLLSGNLFIQLGNNLKKRAVHQLCEPQTV